MENKPACNPKMLRLHRTAGLLGEFVNTNRPQQWKSSREHHSNAEVARGQWPVHPIVLQVTPAPDTEVGHLHCSVLTFTSPRNVLIHL